MHKHFNLKPFRPLLLGGIIIIAGCARPAPGPAIPDADSNTTSNAAANATSRAAISANKTVVKTESEIPANAQKITIELPAGYKKKRPPSKLERRWRLLSS